MNTEVNLIALWRRLICSAKGPEAPGTRLVLLALSLRMEDGPRCAPLEWELADETGMARTSIVRHLALAEQDGWLTRRRPPRWGRLGRGYSYQLRFPARFDDGGAAAHVNVKKHDIESEAHLEARA